MSAKKKPKTKSSPKKSRAKQSQGNQRRRSTWAWLVEPCEPKGYRWTIAVVFCLTIVLSWLIMSCAPKWRSQDAIGEPTPEEIGSATNSCIVGFLFPLAVFTISFMVFQEVRNRRASGERRERIYRLQAIVASVIAGLVCIHFVWCLFNIIMYADYHRAIPPAGDLEPWDYYYPWHMKLVPRVQDLCTSTAWIMMFACALGLFSQQPSRRAAGTEARKRVVVLLSSGDTDPKTERGRIVFCAIPLERREDFQSNPLEIVSFEEAKQVAGQLASNATSGQVGRYEWRAE